jgi:hypothetical protein
MALVRIIDAFPGDHSGRRDILAAVRFCDSNARLSARYPCGSGRPKARLGQCLDVHALVMECHSAIHNVN